MRFRQQWKSRRVRRLVVATAVTAGFAAAAVGCGSPARVSDAAHHSRTVVPSAPASRPVSGTPVSRRASAPPTRRVARWPAQGQASYAIDGVVRSSPGQRPVPIASIAKVMTAYLAILLEPSSASLTVRPADVADTAARRASGQSTLPVRVGETLTERQALEALMLPSANNVAAMLAREVSGSQTAFVARMNATARSLGMGSTTYTDPSGFAAGTVSTAADQLRLLDAAMRLTTLRQIVALRAARFPVVGTLRNLDTLVGTHGFVGVKTGSDKAAGGCFAFQAERAAGTVTGVVLGQRGPNLIAAGLSAAASIVDQVAPLP